MPSGPRRMCVSGAPTAEWGQFPADTAVAPVVGEVLLGSMSEPLGNASTICGTPICSRSGMDKSLYNPS